MMRLFSPVWVLLFLLAGCAMLPAPQPPSAVNPADPDAAEAPLSPPSNTLATTVPDATNPSQSDSGGMGDGMKGMNMTHGEEAKPADNGGIKDGSTKSGDQKTGEQQ